MLKVLRLFALVAASACAGPSLTDSARIDLQPGDASIKIVSIQQIPGADSLVVTVGNTAAHSVFFARCGSGPRLTTQQFVNGAWLDPVEGFLCVVPAAPGPVELAPGASLSVSFIAPAAGVYRIVAYGSGSLDLSNPQLFASDPFTTP